MNSSTSTELMSGVKSREWVHQKTTNQPTKKPDGSPQTLGKDQFLIT